jgi:hypothetical protein
MKSAILAIVAAGVVGIAATSHAQSTKKLETYGGPSAPNTAVRTLPAVTDKSQAAEAGEAGGSSAPMAGDAGLSAGAGKSSAKAQRQ